MFVEAVEGSDTECALCQVRFGGIGVFLTDLVAFQFGVRIVYVILEHGRERRYNSRYDERRNNAETFL